ncbi:uncharacterized protein LOC144141460 [Haemaphysalis longicornis]
MQFFLKFSIASSLATMALGAARVGLTWDLYQDIQYRPIMMYECYRTGVTIEPEGTLNFTVLWDGTDQMNDEGAGTTWMAKKGKRDIYSTGTFDFMYDDGSSSIFVQSGDIKENIVQLLPTFNDLAYYFEITITSQNNRVVYKIYDEDSSCGNAAVGLGKADPQKTKGFVFAREVPRPTKVCTRNQLCASED